jgi:hypothetical protein
MSEPEWLARAKELRERKWSYLRIGADIGEPHQRVYYWLNRARVLEKATVENARRVTRVCPDCGESYERHPSRLGQGKCYSCSSNRKRTGETRACETCGADFYAKAGDLRRGGGRFCRRACWAGGMTSPSLLPGVADKISAARTKTGKRTGLRQRQLEHAGFTLKAKGEDCCRNCGADGHLNLHHVIPRSMWKAGITEPLNGVPLCVACHMGWHHRRVVICRDIFTAEEWACISSADLLGQNVEAWLDDRYPPEIEEAA